MLCRKPLAIISRRGDHPDRLFQLNLGKFIDSFIDTKIINYWPKIMRSVRFSPLELDH